MFLQLKKRVSGLAWLVVGLLFWASGSMATPVLKPLDAVITASPSGSVGAGDILQVIVGIGPGTTENFNSLDAMMGWDPAVLIPINLVAGSSENFVTVSTNSSVPAGVFDSTFSAALTDASPGDSSIFVLIQSSSSPQPLVNGPGELFRLKFQVATGVSLPASTVISFLPLDDSCPPATLGVDSTFCGNSLAVTQSFDAQGDDLVDGNGDEQPLIYATTPTAFTIQIKTPPTQQIPEPSTMLLMLAGLGMTFRIARR